MADESIVIDDSFLLDPDEQLEIDEDIPPFTPIYGTLSEMENTGGEGCVYFATDVKKIFHYYNGKYQLMGNNAGIWYADYDHEALYGTPTPEMKDFYFDITNFLINKNVVNASDLSIPYINDLVFNEKDNSFYKVLEILEGDNQITVHCYKLAVAGSGGYYSGGGSGSSNPSDPTYIPIGSDSINFYPKNGDSQRAMNCIWGQSCLLDFFIEAKKSNEDLLEGQTEATIKVGLTRNTLKTVATAWVNTNVLEHFDISPYLTRGQTSFVYIYVNITDSQGGEKPLSGMWKITPKEFDLAWENLSTFIPENQTDYTISWNLGDAKNAQQHTLLISVNGTVIKQIRSQRTDKLQYYDNIHDIYYAGWFDNTYNITLSREDLGLDHGSYQISIQGVLQFSGDSKTYYSNKITHSVISVIEGNDSPIINIDCSNFTPEQFNPLLLPITIYDPRLKDEPTATLHASLYEKENKLGEWAEKNNVAKNFYYYPLNEGDTILSVRYLSAEQRVMLQVKEVSVSEVKEPDGCEFKLDARTILNNDSLKELTIPVYKLSGVLDRTAYLSFSESFNWEVGGLKTDEEGEEGNKKPTRKYIHIKNGDEMTIQNYHPFTDMTISTEQGFCFKIIFKVTNSTDHAGTFLTCGNMYNGDNEINISTSFINLQTEQGYFGCGDTLKVNFCENKWIELEFDISGTNREINGMRYITAWLNGTPAYVTTYTSGTGFTQSGTGSLLTFMPQGCDIDISLIKIYKKHLSDDEHLNNFIRDASTVKEMTERFVRNDIMSEDGKYVDFSKLIKNNPKCAIYNFEVSKLPQGKDEIDFVHNNQSYANFEYYTDGQTTPKYTSGDFKMRCQGTSSLSYGISAFNLDVQFNELKDGTTKEQINNGWSMTKDYSIPVDYFNFKVNVASSEGANNALNQEWYNRYLPYKTYYQRYINSKTRNSMEFYKPGLLFLIDHNPKKIGDADPVAINAFANVSGYMTSIGQNEPKLYAICNMGNSKFNTEVFCNGYNEKLKRNAVDNALKNGTIDSLNYYADDQQYYNINDITFEVNDNTTDLHWMKAYLEYNTEATNVDELFPSGSLYYASTKMLNSFYENRPVIGLKSGAKETYTLVEEGSTYDPNEHYYQQIITVNADGEEKKTYPEYLSHKDMFSEYDINLINASGITFTEAMAQKIYIKHTDATGGKKQKIIECRWEQPNIEYEKSLEEEGKQIFASQEQKDLIDAKCKQQQVDVCKKWLRLSNWFAKYHPGFPTNDPLINPETGTQFLADGVTRYEEHYDDGFTFNGYNYTNWKTGEIVAGPKQWNDESSTDERKQILKGLTITRYKTTSGQGNGYQIDSFERRMAKLLSECEDYLIMDALVFHYLFVERHCLVDNIAKNTFWHTEDGFHWAPIKDYDNDTADGIDNDGFARFHYGYEPFDRIDYADDLNVQPVFNAQDSAWLSFIYNLPEAREKVYNALCDTYAYVKGNFTKEIEINGETIDISNAWEADPYIKTFNNWQEAIPERMWIEDCRRKYKRPYEIFRNSGYLARLAGGKKTFQREQFERFQEYYMDSEYVPSTFKTNPLQLRSAAGTTTNIDIRPYCNCYIRYSMGSGNDINSLDIRCTAGEYSSFPVTAGDTNTTFYIYGSKYITGLRKLETLKCSQIVVSAAEKLTELIVSNGTPNPNLADISCENKLLEKLIMKNCSGAAISGAASGEASNFAITDCINLKELDLTGTYIKNLQIPPYTPLHSIKISGFTNLTMKKLTQVNTFLIDTDGSHSLPTSMNILLDDIDYQQLSSKSLVFDTVNNLSTFCLKNIKWSLNLDDVSGNTIRFLDMLYEGVNNGTKIPADFAIKEGIIESGTDINKTYLYYDTILDNISIQDVVSGTITLPPLNDNQILSIYNKYNLSNSSYYYPNLNINFQSDTIKKVKIFDGNNNIKWERCYNNTDNITLTDEFLNYSKYGAFNETVTKEKSMTNYFVYNFIGWEIYEVEQQEIEGNFVDVETLKVILRIPTDEEKLNEDFITNGKLLIEQDGHTEIIKENIKITDYTPIITKNITIKPKHEQQDRLYQIDFKIPFGNIDKDFSINAKYGENFYDLFYKYSRYIPYKINDTYDLYETDIFTGFSTSNNNINISYENAQISNNHTLYACFEKGSVFDPKNLHRLNGEWFVYNTQNRETYPPSITPCRYLGGKIVLPTYLLVQKDFIPIDRNELFDSSKIHYRKIANNKYEYWSNDGLYNNKRTDSNYDFYTIDFDLTEKNLDKKYVYATSLSSSNSAGAPLTNGNFYFKITHIFFESAIQSKALYDNKQITEDEYSKIENNRIIGLQGHPSHVGGWEIGVSQIEYIDIENSSLRYLSNNGGYGDPAYWISLDGYKLGGASIALKSRPENSFHDKNNSSIAYSIAGPNLNKDFYLADGILSRTKVSVYRYNIEGNVIIDSIHGGLTLALDPRANSLASDGTAGNQVAKKNSAGNYLPIEITLGSKEKPCKQHLYNVRTNKHIFNFDPSKVRVSFIKYYYDPNNLDLSTMQEDIENNILNPYYNYSEFPSDFNAPTYQFINVNGS